MNLAAIKKSNLAKKILALTIIITACLLCSGSGWSAEPFSFVVIGDTRTEPFLPGSKNQEAAIMQVLKDRFQVTPENTELIFDDLGGELLGVKMVIGDQTTTIKYQNGWPQQIIVLDNETKKSQVVMRSNGRRWVSDQVVAKVQKGSGKITDGASFIVHGGDIPLFGLQGKTLASNPYYQLFNAELLMRLPVKPNATGLPGNFFPAVGNHATWGDEDIVGFRETLPWLKQLGFSQEFRIYSFVYNNCSFIFLDSGGWSSSGAAWSSNFPVFKQQMAYLKEQLNDAKANYRDHVFVTYHKPSFNQIGHDPLPPDQNPHEILKKFATELSIFVFSSHVHTTEQYLVDGISYQVIGGGGAPQKFTVGHNPSPQKELYWNGEERTEEYNYLDVAVNGSHIRGTINRFRPLETSSPFGDRVIFQK